MPVCRRSDPILQHGEDGGVIEKPGAPPSSPIGDQRSAMPGWYGSVKVPTVMSKYHNATDEVIVCLVVNNVFYVVCLLLCPRSQCKPSGRLVSK